MPQVHIEALSRLQEIGPAVPPGVIRTIIENQLGNPVEALYATFEQKPAAAASFAQVHRATLADGTVVAVKIQRPDLERLVCRVLDAMESGLGWLYRLFPQRLRRAAAIVGMPGLTVSSSLFVGKAVKYVLMAGLTAREVDEVSNVFGEQPARLGRMRAPPWR